MKKFVFLLIPVILGSNMMGQSPEKMNYQAIIRDVNNHLIANKNIGMQISILQGGESGTPVYVERHFPTTNENGLVTLEIGTGTVVQGDFSSIDWLQGPFYLKTETDLNGGANYTITGTSQLLSVPYALQAKSVENINESDPVFKSWDKDYNDLAHTPNITDTISAVLDTTGQFIRKEIDGDITNEIQTISRKGLTVTLSRGGGSFKDSVNTYKAGDGIDITGTVISKHKDNIGDFAHGGIVFWLDDTGEHGLVCAKQDQSTGIRWYAGSNTYTMAKGLGPYAGEMNTAIIIANQSIGDGNPYAALICSELWITEGDQSFGDWYLPSRYELDLMYNNKEVINTTAVAHGGAVFSGTVYWSSSEAGLDKAWTKNFVTGALGTGSKSISSYYVRAVRRF